MKKFVIIARNMRNDNCIVVTEIKANTRKEAQQIAMRDYYQYLEPNEQMVVANDRQWEEIWRDKVAATDELVDSLKIRESEDKVKQPKRKSLKERLPHKGVLIDMICDWASNSNPSDVRRAIREYFNQVIYYYPGEDDEFIEQLRDLLRVKGFTELNNFLVSVGIDPDPDDFYESRKPRRTKRIRTERYMGKYYWSYRYDHPFIDEVDRRGSYFTDASIRNIPLLARENPDDCYTEKPWRIAVEDSDYNGKPLYCTEDQAYKRLKDYLNSTMYERRNDL